MTDAPPSRIPIAGPWITEREIGYAADAARNGWYEGWNEYVIRFERAMADYLGMPYAMSTSSCTDALQLTMAALGIGPGDEVIVPELTWIASASPATHLGATPNFADVDAAT